MLKVWSKHGPHMVKNGQTMVKIWSKHSQTNDQNMVKNMIKNKVKNMTQNMVKPNHVKKHGQKLW
jgi:LysM repeat protein